MLRRGGAALVSTPRSRRPLRLAGDRLTQGRVVLLRAMERLALSDQLLLAQAVHQVGTDPVDWARVSGLLLAHPLVNNAARKQALGGQSLDTLFGADACRDAWTQLMKRHGLAADGEPRQDRGSQLSLARILYADRLVQLREEIGAKEQKFRVLILSLIHI